MSAANLHAFSSWPGECSGINDSTSYSRSSRARSALPSILFHLATHLISDNHYLTDYEVPICPRHYQQVMEIITTRRVIMDFVIPLTSSYACASVSLTTAAKYAAEPNPVLPGFVNKEEKASTLLNPGQQHRRFHTPEMTEHHPISSLLTQASAVTCMTIGGGVCVGVCLTSSCTCMKDLS